MDQVAAAAELSKGTLYLYFPSKDELFMGLACEVIDGAIAELMPLMADQDLLGLTLFRQMAEGYVKVALSHPNTIRNGLIWFASGDMVDTDTEGFKGYRARTEKVQGLLMAAILRGQRDGSIRSGLDPMTTIAQVWPSLMSSVVLRVNIDELERRLDKTVDRDELIPGLIDLFVRGLAASPSSEESK